MRNDPEPGGCAMVVTALLILGFVYAVAAYLWTEHREDVVLGGALVAALAAAVWLTGRAQRRARAAERRAQATEAATVAAMTPAERDAEIVRRKQAIAADQERVDSRRLLAQTRADEAYGTRCVRMALASAAVGQFRAFGMTSLALETPSDQAPRVWSAST